MKLQFAEATNACYRVGDGFLPILDIDALIKRVSRQADAAPHREAQGGER